MWILRRDGISLHVGLLGELFVEELLSSGHHVLVLDSHDTTSPGSSDVDVLNVSLGEVGSELLDLNQVLGVHIGESDAGGSLEVDELSEGGFAADEAEWGSLLSAESWEMDHQLNWVNIVSNDNNLGLSFLNKGGDVVETELEKLWLVSLVSAFASLLSLSQLLESLGLFFSGLWRVLCEKFNQFASCNKSNSHY